mmetsp:Transcript_46443/g.89598  ORF Transcript_46443/g.89598 Transcript_46443/m.89598 type:complete len:232 (+) Transcript_46443:81-776(+)
MSRERSYRERGGDRYDRGDRGDYGGGRDRDDRTRGYDQDRNSGSTGGCYAGDRGRDRDRERSPRRGHDRGRGGEPPDRDDDRGGGRDAYWGGDRDRGRERDHDRGCREDRERERDREKDRGVGDNGERGGGGGGGGGDDDDGRFKCSIEGPGATPPSRNTENCYRAVVEMKKPGDRAGTLGGTGSVRMTCAWQGDKRTAERDGEKLKRAWRRGGFDEVQKVKGELRAAARR